LCVSPLLIYSFDLLYVFADLASVKLNNPATSIKNMIVINMILFPPLYVPVLPVLLFFAVKTIAVYNNFYVICYRYAGFFFVVGGFVRMCSLWYAPFILYNRFVMT